MAFHDVQISEDVEQGAVGGPQFKTNVIALISGHEKRNVEWSRARAAWNIGYGIGDAALFREVLEFFYARQGKAHSFRFKDWADFEITAQSIGTTDTTTATFQIYKRYTSGGINYDRNILKPLASGWVVTVNAVSQTVVYDTAPAADEVAIATLTGILTLGSTHQATTGQDIAITGEFDIPVRFDTDDLQQSITNYDAGLTPDIPIVEVRDE